MIGLYNEMEPYAAAWLRNLIAAGHIAPGRVDDRSIRDLAATDLVGVRQAHFFAGIGVWSYALRLAGWPDDRPVWTGSCPCQPFSVAGKGLGTADERHLWPEWFRLIRECGPPTIFGEQVAGPDGLAWLDAVCADLEGCGYAVGAAVLPAAGVGAPHIRHRIFFGARRLANADAGGRAIERGGGLLDGVGTALGHDADERAAWARGLARLVADTCGDERGSGRAGRANGDRAIESSGRGDALDPWRSCEWIPCRDGKARPVEPGTFPLAHGAPARVGRLRAYGNAIVAQAAATFVAAFMDSTDARGAA